jgi:hypothetical protein
MAQLEYSSNELGARANITLDATLRSREGPH